MNRIVLHIWLWVLLLGWSMSLLAVEHTSYLSSIEHKDGLSNSAVLSIYQDSAGLMWIGTYDGLNCYDGNRIEVFRTDFSAHTTLDNNIIADIRCAGRNQIWVCSFQGVSRFSLDTRSVTANYSVDGEFKLFANGRGDTWLVDKSSVYYFNTLYHTFLPVADSPKLDFMQMSAFVDSKGGLSVLGSGYRDLFRYAVSSFSGDSLAVRVERQRIPFHDLAVTKAFCQQDVCFFLDERNDAYLYDPVRNTKVFLANTSELMARYGEISNMVPFFGDIMVSFRSQGIVRLRASERYAGEVVRLNIRAFCLYTDQQQGILWVGTDGQGVLRIARQNDLVSNVFLHQLSPNLNGQVRGIFTDAAGRLWVGTKGDGLLCIPDYASGIDGQRVRVYTPEESTPLAQYERGSDFYPVFSMTRSRCMDGFWVGMSDTALYAYVPALDRLKALPGSLGGRIAEVHGVCETADSTLWIATVGTGFHRVKLRYTGADGWRAVRHKRYRFYDKQQELLEFSALCASGDSVLWLASRGKGLVRFDTRTEEYQVISLKHLLGQPVDDILCLYLYQGGVLYAGTTAGLVSVNSTGGHLVPQYVGREDGLFNDMIHGIVCDADGLLWLGTNKGLIRYNPAGRESYTYYYSRGVEVCEFSDDSYYECPYSGNLFLGGINGLLYFNRRNSDNTEYYPELVLRSIAFGHERNYWKDFWDAGTGQIVLPDKRNSFSIEFVVPDYLVNDIEYSYWLEGHDKTWTNFSKANEAFYADLPSGNYVFRVRYKKDIFDSVYKEFSVPLVIVSPWYRSSWAYGIFLLLILGGVWLLFRVYRSYLLARFTGSQKPVRTQEVSVVSECPKPETPVSEQPSVSDEVAQLKARILQLVDAGMEDCLRFHTAEQARFLLDVVELINNHLEMEDLSIAFLADRKHVSVRQFYRKFKEAADLLPVDLVKRMRMNRAALLLRTTEMSIQEVIDAVGIASRSYFYKEFTLRFGVTPGAMRGETGPKTDSSD